MDDVSISVFFPIPAEYRYGNEKLLKMTEAVVSQNRPFAKIYFLNQQTNSELADQLVAVVRNHNLDAEIIPANHSLLEVANQILHRCQTTHFLWMANEEAPVLLSQSACSLFSWAALRNTGSGLFYSDYEVLTPEGSKDVHLLPYHPGRVRDNMDLGYVFLVNTERAREVGGFSPHYPHGYIYDLRLKLSEKSHLTHIANRYHGVPYRVEAVGKGHNVFDYLLSSKEVQLEMEQILSDHLKRIGAYLPPGAFQEEVTYTPEEDEQFRECLASVIIPVNRRPQFIGAAIESVWQQTISQVEVIVVVNGGDQDPTIEEVRRYMPGGDLYQRQKPPVRLLIHDINNIGLCLNEGLKVARGKYYVQLDSDDRLKPDAVEKLLNVFNSDPKIAMVIGSYEVWQLEDDGHFFRREDIPVVTHDEWTEENGRNNLLRINGAGAPRSAHIKVLKEMGWFGVNDSPYSRNYGEDYEMVLKISERYRIGRVWEPIYQVVRHSGGTDHSIDQETIDRNDNAKDHMRLRAIRRRQRLNGVREENLIGG